MEAGCVLEFALRAAAGVEVGAVRPGTDSTGWFHLKVEVLVSSWSIGCVHRSGCIG